MGIVGIIIWTFSWLLAVGCLSSAGPLSSGYAAAAAILFVGGPTAAAITLVADLMGPVRRHLREIHQLLYLQWQRQEASASDAAPPGEPAPTPPTPGPDPSFGGKILHRDRAPKPPQ